MASLVAKTAHRRMVALNLVAMAISTMVAQEIMALSLVVMAIISVVVADQAIISVVVAVRAIISVVVVQTINLVVVDHSNHMAISLVVALNLVVVQEIINLVVDHSSHMVVTRTEDLARTSGVGRVAILGTMLQGVQMGVPKLWWWMMARQCSWRRIRARQVTR